jgi:hypothetical protein
MANLHVIKLTESEAVVKIYDTNNNGNTINVSLEDDLTKSGQTFVSGTSKVTIQKLFWGVKSNKHIDIRRAVIEEANTYHGHYYLNNSGSYDYVGFVDNLYATGDIQVISDGEFHLILVLGKSGWS